MAHWLFLLPRALPSSPHLSPLALWRPEALAQWNGDSLGPSPPLRIGAISAVVLRCRPAAGTVPDTAAVPFTGLRLRVPARPSVCLCRFALLAPDCHRHFHLSEARYCVPCAPALLASQYPDVAVTLPSAGLQKSSVAPLAKDSADASQSVRPEPSLPACVTAHHVLAAAHGRGPPGNWYKRQAAAAQNTQNALHCGLSSSRPARLTRSAWRLL